jgi:hypothetical protein
MLRILTSQRGNIAMAMAILLITSASAITLVIGAMTDTMLTLKDCDDVQIFHCLKSGSERCAAVLDKFEGRHEGFYLPVKQITVTSSHAVRNITTQNRIMVPPIFKNPFEFNFSDYRVLSLVSVKRGKPHLAYMNYLLPGSSGFGEEYVSLTNSAAAFHYFTDKEETTNGTPHMFWGPDVLYGRVHSNDDIWIFQAGGGTNNGWPTFYGPVSTAGQIIGNSGTPPYAQVFRAGYFEHVSEINFSSGASDIRAHGAPVGGTAYDPNRIMIVRLTGAAYNSHVGMVINAGPDTAAVFAQYPPPGGGYLFRNRYTRYDTIWSAGPTGNATGHSNMVYSKLWIKGYVSGRQTWCSADTMYIMDNVYLAGTQLGQCPDGSIQGSQVNRTDLLGLVSEKSILVQYGHKDPVDSMRYHPNCSSDQDGVWIYAALAALGDGNGDTHRDGVFSFEYQHPHPSVPATRLPGSNYVWNNIDLHRWHYPQTPNYPWPAELDYPWYNPLWPEAAPYMERGTIHLWGSVIQRRSGFVHRQTSDTDYPNPQGIWSIPNDFCGGTSGVPYTDPVLGTVYTPVNAPGASGGGAGYKKDYRYDNRFLAYSPPDFPTLHYATPGSAYASRGWNLKKPPRNLTALD